MLTKAASADFLSKYSKTSNIVKYDCNLKQQFSIVKYNKKIFLW